ncbi:MAG TPA: hypothetical protein VGJ07_21400 [Rugosimonospora sp.]
MALRAHRYSGNRGGADDSEPTCPHREFRGAAGLRRAIATAVRTDHGGPGRAAGQLAEWVRGILADR